MFRKIFRRRLKVGLALGGGGSRGAANVGVLKALIENNIPIDLLAGTSSGALVGAFYAGGVSIQDTIKATMHTDWFTIARIKINGLWPISGSGIEDFVRKNVGKKNIEDLRIPFHVIATDYMTGEKVILNKGDLARIIHASSAIPGVFAPVEFNGKLLIDGLIVDNVPAQDVRNMGADYVIAVDVVPDIKLTEGPKNVRQLVERAVDIASRNHCKEICKGADIVIKPVNINIPPLDFGKADQLIKMGETAALKVIKRIKKDLSL